GGVTERESDVREKRTRELGKEGGSIPCRHAFTPPKEVTSPSDLKPRSRTPSKPHRRVTVAVPPSNPSHRRCRDVIAVAREKRCVRKEARRGEKRRRLCCQLRRV
ncbi:hypothetical protein HN51_066444, partial [Arachis hypogaea]